MKKLLLSIFASFVLCTNCIKAQVLAVGDIAFTGYNATPNAPQLDAFSFVLLVNIPAGTIINFTDHGWLAAGGFRTGFEQTVTWTAGSALVAGREIIISGPAAGTATSRISGSNINPGTCTGAMLSLNPNGDQIIAYQGPQTAAATVISAIHMNVYTIAGMDGLNTTAANWEGDATNNFTSAKPPTLTTGTNAIWFGTEATLGTERNNAVHRCVGPLATPAQIRASVNNQANWNSQFGISGDVPSWVPPSGCAFLASIFPSRLLSFSASNNGAFIALNWQTENEVDMLHYEVERSFDGIQFTSIKTVQAQRTAFAGNYLHNDAEALLSNHSTVYYRIKFVDRVGEHFYTDVKAVKINKKGSILVENLMNPFKGSLAFSLINKNAQHVTIRINDMAGNNLLQQTTKFPAGETNIRLDATNGLPAGIYTLEIISLNDRKTFKLVKTN